MEPTGINHDIEKQFKELEDKAKQVYPTLENDIKVFASNHVEYLKVQDQAYAASGERTTISNHVIL